MTDHRNTPKPIETHYAGCRFRSRLEARWAVFFDHLGIVWQYESEGYELSTGDRYLPDFYLPDFDQWVEVKGKMSHRDFQRLLVAATELPAKLPHQVRPGVLILGPVPQPGQPYTHARVGAVGDNVTAQSAFFTRRSTIYPIGPLVVWDLAGVLRLTDEETAWVRDSFTGAAETDDLALVSLVDDAYRAARSARFEHGKSG